MTTDWNAFCKERSGHLRERIEAEERRIMQIEKNNAKLSELSAQMGEIIKIHQERITDQDDRITKLESGPKNITDSIRTAAISAGVSGLVTYIIGQLI